MPHEARRSVATSTQQEGNIIHGGRSQKLTALNDGQSELDAVFHLPKRSQLIHPDLDRDIKPLQSKQAVRCGGSLLPQGRRYGPDEGDSAKIITEPSQEADDHEDYPASKSGVTHRQPSSKELETGGNCDRKEASSNARVGKKSMGGRSDDLDNAVREVGSKRVKSMRYDAGPPHGIGDYVGYVHDGVPHGKGTMEWPSGKRYTGEWNNGKRHGRGWHMWTDGRTFEGEWKDGKPHGMGKWTSPRGEAYDGELVRGKKCGKGTFTYVDGRKYIGEWLDGMRHGKGTRDYPDGSWYTGSWSKDKRHGWGEYTWRDGRVWAGQWREGNPVKTRRKRLDSRVSPALVRLDLEEHDVSGTALDHPMESEHEEQQQQQQQHVEGDINAQEYRRQNSGRRGEGHPPPAPLPTRSKAAAEAIKEMRELKEFLSTSDKLRKPIVLVGDGEDTIERQGTASTQAGTITASEWSRLSEPGGYGTNRGFVRQQGGAGLVKAQERDSDQDTEDTQDTQNAQHQGNQQQQQRQASSKHKRLFGGAAEKFVQWGPSRVLTSVTRRRSSDSNSSGSQAQSQSKLRSQSQSQSQSQPQSQPQSQSQSQSQPQSQSQSQSQPQSQSQSQSQFQSQPQSQSQSREGLGSRNDLTRDGTNTSEEMSKDKQGSDSTRTSKRSERTPRRQTSGGDDLLNASMTSSTRVGHESPRDASHRREREKKRGDYGVGGSLFVDNGAPFEGSGLQARPARSRIEVSRDHRSRRDRTVLLVDQTRGAPSENSGDIGFGSGTADGNGDKNKNVDDKVKNSKNSIANNTSRNKFGTHGPMNSNKTSLQEVHTPNGIHGARTTRGSVDPLVAATLASPSTVSLNSPTTTTRSLAEEDTTRSRMDSSETISGVRDADSRAVSPHSSISHSTSRSDRCRNINRFKDPSPSGSKSQGGSQAAVTYRRPVHGEIDMDYPSSPSSRHSRESGPTARRTSLAEVRPTDEDTEGEVSDFDEPDQVMATRRTPRRVRRPLLRSGKQRERSNGDGFSGQRASTHRESEETLLPMNNHERGLLDRKREAQESTEHVKRAEGIRQIRAAALRSVKLTSTSRIAGRRYGSTQLSRRRGKNGCSDTDTDKHADTQSMSDSNATVEPSDRTHGRRRGSSREQSTGDEVMDMSFDAGFPHGVGSYSGEVKNGVPDGQGAMIWPSGERYKGEWQQGKRTGYGTFTWEGGRIHQGGWLNNKAHGEGTFWYGDGSSYVGGWTDGLKHGRGKRTYADRSIYDGEWQHGMRHGKARWCGSDGIYEGEYANDVKSGKGIYTWSDGRKYSGSWRDGKMHGQGILYSKSGAVLLKGKWRRGEKTLFF